MKVRRLWELGELIDGSLKEVDCENAGSSGIYIYWERIASSMGLKTREDK